MTDRDTEIQKANDLFRVMQMLTTVEKLELRVSDARLELALYQTEYRWQLEISVSSGYRITCLRLNHNCQNI